MDSREKRFISNLVALPDLSTMSVTFNVFCVSHACTCSGSDMTCPDFSGTSPFHLCLQESATECLGVALQLLPTEILAVPHPQFLLPLLHAVQVGNKEACQLLVRAGADVNQVRLVAYVACLVKANTSATLSPD